MKQNKRIISAMCIAVLVISITVTVFMTVGNKDKSVAADSTYNIKTFAYDMTNESENKEFSIPAICDSEMETMSEITEKTSEIAKETTTETTTKTTTQSSVKKENNKDSTTQKQSKPKETTTKAQTTNTPMKRIFTVNGIKVDATNSSAFDETLEYVKIVISKLPRIVSLTRCKNIVLTDEITAYGAGSNTAGLADMGGKTMYVKTYLQPKADLKSTIYHELGHFVDAYLSTGEYTQNPSWKKLVAEEGAPICAFYGRDITPDSYHGARESFAMAFEAYYLGSINGQAFNLKSKCPKIYKCLDEILSAKYEIIVHSGGARYYFKTIDEVYAWVYDFTDSEKETNKTIEWCNSAAYGSRIDSDWGYGVICRK